MPHDDQKKKCFDLFDRAEGKTCILALYSFVCGIFVCFGHFHLWCPGLDCIYSCSLPPFFIVHRIASKSVF